MVKRGGVAPYFLPDPALGWLLRASGGLGVWISELPPGEEGPRAERVVDAEHLSVAQITGVDRRLERARDSDEGGSEPMDGGTLVFRTAGGVAAGVLLPGTPDAASIARVGHDLDGLVTGLRRRPDAVAAAQAQGDEAAFESAASVGLRLAYQLERSLGAEVVVVAREVGGVRVAGVSGRGDGRLADTVLPPDSALARVATGAAGQHIVSDDPLGDVVPDRRERQGAMLLVPIPAGAETVGAVAIHIPTGAEPSGAARAELIEALAQAGPRLAAAFAEDRSRNAAVLDPLTGLLNRRGLDALLCRGDGEAGTTGALIFVDLDRFRVLNDALGSLAGDAVLLHLARILREQVRGSDSPARIGGEEFAVWLPDASLELALRVAERIRIKLGTTPWDWKGRHWPLSASFGVAACPETGRSVEQLGAQAAGALEAAKRSGRNRVEAAARAV
ncbi:MAG TPA: GGDEF domain-containing protein [Gemmatimonadales bacterium]|nr:GGDEF domain-containing protein [Gemmatimonadales bacterium]